MYSFKEQYQTYQNVFEKYANDYANGLQTKPNVLGEGMAYSLLLGGKRIRPVLALATAEMLGVSQEEVLPFALALEMIHTYSLIHDDLPAMDNDDFRRGKPSNHKAFGEANAILAGDGLLNSAYSICFEQCVKGEKYVYASKFLNECAGIYGMIAGQSADIYFSEGKTKFTEEDLLYVYQHKTGKLLLAPVAIAGILAGYKNFSILEKFGERLGVLFQLTDDILDVVGEFDKMGKSIGKDEAENKLTGVRIYGLEAASVKADICAAECHALLEGIQQTGEAGKFLSDLIDYVRNRTN